MGKHTSMTIIKQCYWCNIIVYNCIDNDRFPTGVLTLVTIGRPSMNMTKQAIPVTSVLRGRRRSGNSSMSTVTITSTPTNCQRTDVKNNTCLRVH